MSWFSDIYNDVSGKTAQQIEWERQQAAIQQKEADIQAEQRAKEEALAKYIAEQEELQSQATAKAKTDADAATAAAAAQAKADATASAQQRAAADAAANAAASTNLANVQATSQDQTSQDQTGQDPNYLTNLAAAEQAERDRVEQQRIANRDALRNEGRQAGINTTNAYFSGRGVNPANYSSDINSAINSIFSTFDPEQTDFTGAFTNTGPDLYGTLEGNLRSGARGSLATPFAEGFEKQRIADTADDQFINSIQSQHRADADAIVNNMFKRKVITDKGANAAYGRLGGQEGDVRGLLDQLGTGYLNLGRHGLTNIANEGRFAADTIGLGNSWDPTVYTKRADEHTKDFLSRLGENITGALPEGNLYDTSGLAAAAGQGQGQQNLKFDPNALSGVIEEGESTEQDNELFAAPNTKKRKRGSGIF